MRSATMEMLCHDKRSLEEKVLQAIRFTAREPKSRTLEVLFEENPTTDRDILHSMVDVALRRILTDEHTKDVLRRAGMLHLQADCARKLMGAI